MKKRLRIRLGSRLRIRGASNEWMERVFRETSFPNPAYEATVQFSRWGPSASIPETLDFSEFEGERGLYVSRGSVAFLSPKLRKRIHRAILIDKRRFVRTKWPRLRLTLNDEQQECMQALKRVLANGQRPFGNLLFLASTSAGKTILQIAIARYLGQSVLVVCPTDQIMRAWYADLTKALGLTRNQIGLIRGKAFSIRLPVTLTTPQTLCRREERWKEINTQFGAVVVDETQIVSAPKLFAFLQQSPAAYRIGATATQQARVGVNHHLRALFGEPVLALNVYGRNTSTAMRITDVSLVETPFRFTHQSDNIDWFQLGLALTSSEERNRLIVRNIHKEWSEGRVILLVTKLREHVEVLYEMLTEAGVVNVNRLTGDTNADNFYTKKLLKLVADRKVTCIVATQQAIKIGANIPALDSLHIAIPPANTRDFEQLVGRIRRKTDGKTKASVTYYLDVKVGYLMRLYRKIAVPVFSRLQVPGYDFQVYQ